MPQDQMLRQTIREAAVTKEHVSSIRGEIKEIRESWNNPAMTSIEVQTSATKTDVPTPRQSYEVSKAMAKNLAVGDMVKVTVTVQKA